MFADLTKDLLDHKVPIAVVGLGYVGLPLAVVLSRRFKVIGFDVDAERIKRLQEGIDDTREVDGESLKKAELTFTGDPSFLSGSRFIIVAVPSPIDGAKRPDLNALLSASRTIGRVIKPGSVVVYESTVYPGVTEDILVPVLEEESGLKCGADFSVGYSPERINPGDKKHTVERIVKVVSGKDDETLEVVAGVYGEIITAGIHRAPSIKVAEAAKVIENIQRDLNIALMNELAVIFNLVGVDTTEVLKAAGTKWNFLNFTPGLVGGHCIGVDPYYLTSKAEELGYHPHVILSGRRINDGMGKYIAEQVMKLLIRAGITVNGARVGILGLTFKEDVPDIRNSRVPDILAELKDFCIETIIHDPMADANAVREEHGVSLSEYDQLKDLNGVVIAVGHREYKERGPESIRAMLSDKGGVVVDVKSLFGAEQFDESVIYWRL